MIADVSVKDEVLSKEESDYLIHTPVDFIDTAGCSYDEIVNPESLSISNPEEAQLLVKHLKIVLEQFENSNKSGKRITIGVISPYKEQVQYLTNLIAEDEHLINYRKIEQKDNVKVAKLIRDILLEHELNQPGTVYFDPTTDALFELFQTENSCYYIAENSSEIIGACGIFPTEGLPEKHIELVKFYVNSDFRGKGIGKKLMELSLDVAKNFGFKKVYLESLPELEKAVGMYESFGFKHIPKRLGNSGHCACNILMLKELD